MAARKLQVLDKAMKDEARQRLEDAKTDRSHIESYIDSVISYGMPGRRKMSERRIVAVDDDEQEFIYDNEFQFSIRECAAEMKNIYTPSNRNWAKLKPKEALAPEIAENPDFQQLVLGQTNQLFEAMRMTRLDSALDLALEDWQGAAGCLDINPGPGGRATLVEHVPLPELYMESCPELPSGIDGRWREMDIMRRRLKMKLPMVDWEQVLIDRRRSSNANSGSEVFEVAYGYRFDASAWPRERWLFEVFLDGELVHSKPVVGAGAVGLIPFRSAENSPSPWGRGPASIALSPARALDQIAFLTLKVLPKRVDPPMAYSSLSPLNVQDGIMAGDFIPAGPEFQLFPLESRHGMDALYTEVADLRMQLRRALWQDRPDPYEAGTTPPTAYQIQTQELGRAVRQERPRSRFNSELVVPVMERFLRIEQKARRMAPLEIEGHKALVMVVPQSPLQRAKDLEDVQQATMMLELVRGTLGDQGVLTIDLRNAIDKVAMKLGEGVQEIIKVRNQQEVVAETAEQAGAEAVGAAAGESLALAA